MLKVFITLIITTNTTPLPSIPHHHHHHHHHPHTYHHTRKLIRLPSNTYRHFSGYLVIRLYLSSFLRLPGNKLKRSFNSYSKNTKTPLWNMKPYAPGFCGSHPASIPVDKNDCLSVSLSILLLLLQSHLSHFTLWPKPLTEMTVVKLSY